MQRAPCTCHHQVSHSETGEDNSNVTVQPWSPALSALNQPLVDQTDTRMAPTDRHSAAQQTPGEQVCSTQQISTGTGVSRQLNMASQIHITSSWTPDRHAFSELGTWHNRQQNMCISWTGSTSITHNGQFTHTLTHHLNIQWGTFPDEPGLAGRHVVFIFHVYWKKTFRMITSPTNGVQSILMTVCLSVSQKPHIQTLQIVSAC